MSIVVNQTFPRWLPEESGTGTLNLTDVLEVYSEHYAGPTDIIHHGSTESSDAEVASNCAAALTKSTNMANVMDVVAKLPGVVEGDDFWLEVASYLVSSKAARELMVSESILPENKAKWLRFHLQKLKK